MDLKKQVFTHDASQTFNPLGQTRISSISILPLREERQIQRVLSNWKVLTGRKWVQRAARNRGQEFSTFPVYLQQYRGMTQEARCWGNKFRGSARRRKRKKRHSRMNLGWVEWWEKKNPRKKLKERTSKVRSAN